MNNKLITSFKLDNGLRVVLDYRKVGFINIGCGIRAGSVYENDTNAGTAHFLEHMLFEGTQKYPDSKSLAESLEGIGGRSGAFTDREYVYFSVKIGKEYFNKGLDYLSDILFNPKLDEKAIQKEKNIILEEKKKRDDNPETVVWDSWFKWMFGDKSSFGNPIIGTEEAIRKINKNGLRTYLDTFYQPNNMVLSIVGEFSQKDAKRLIKRYFGLSIKNKLLSVTKKDIKEYKFPKDRKKILITATSQCQLIIGFPTGIGYSNPKYRFPLMLISDYFAGGVSSSIFHRLIYDLGIAYNLGAINWMFKDYGIFFIYSSISKENLDTAVNSILSEVKKIQTSYISAKSLRFAKERIKHGYYFSLESTESRASYYAYEMLMENKIIFEEEYVKNINKVSRETIKNTAKNFIKDPYIIISGPTD